MRDRKPTDLSLFAALLLLIVRSRSSQPVSASRNNKINNTSLVVYTHTHNERHTHTTPLNIYDVMMDWQPRNAIFFFFFTSFFFFFIFLRVSFVCLGFFILSRPSSSYSFVCVVVRVFVCSPVKRIGSDATLSMAELSLKKKTKLLPLRLAYQQQISRGRICQIIHDSPEYPFHLADYLYQPYKQLPLHTCVQGLQKKVLFKQKENVDKTCVLSTQ